jgi:hypothetical protein
MVVVETCYRNECRRAAKEFIESKIEGGSKIVKTQTEME